MLSYFSSKASSSLSLPFLFPFSSHLRHRPSKSQFCPSLPLKFTRLALACHAASAGLRVSMDSSPSADVAVSVDSVARDLQNQSLKSDDHLHQDGDFSNGNNNKKVRLNLEDLNWDHSFVRELPGDPRTDRFQREVSYFFFNYY